MSTMSDGPNGMTPFTIRCVVRFLGFFTGTISSTNSGSSNLGPPSGNTSEGSLTTSSPMSNIGFSPIFTGFGLMLIGSCSSNLFDGSSVGGSGKRLTTADNRCRLILSKMLNARSPVSFSATITGAVSLPVLMGTLGPCVRTTFTPTLC